MGAAVPFHKLDSRTPTIRSMRLPGIPFTAATPMRTPSMEPFAERTVRLARRHPLPALPLQEVVHLLRSDSAGPPPDEDFLLGTLRRRPDLFRILDPWRGPWRGITDVRPEAGARYLPYLRERGLSPRWPWIVVHPPRAAGAGEAGARAEGAALDRLRESILSLSREVDAASAMSLTRWCRLLLEQRDLLRKVGKLPRVH